MKLEVKVCAVNLKTSTQTQTTSTVTAPTDGFLPYNSFRKYDSSSLRFRLFPNNVDSLHKIMLIEFYEVVQRMNKHTQDAVQSMPALLLHP
jgi:hypothetical protein